MVMHAKTPIITDNIVAVTETNKEIPNELIKLSLLKSLLYQLKVKPDHVEVDLLSLNENTHTTNNGKYKNSNTKKTYIFFKIISEVLFFIIFTT